MKCVSNATFHLEDWEIFQRSITVSIGEVRGKQAFCGSEPGKQERWC